MGSVMRINLNNYQIKPLHDSRSLPVDTQGNNDDCREGVPGAHDVGDRLRYRMFVQYLWSYQLTMLSHKLVIMYPVF